MKASSMIGRPLAHATASDMSGVVTDILFDMSLSEAAFFLVDVTTPGGTAPLLFSPTVLILDDGTIKTGAPSDEIEERLTSSIHCTSVDIDPAALPSTLIGPFGNAISPSLIAALFNARTAIEKPEPPMAVDGVWFTEAKDHAIRAHVGDAGHLADIMLNDDFSRCENILMSTFEKQELVVPPSGISATRAEDGTLLLAIQQAEGAS